MLESGGHIGCPTEIPSVNEQPIGALSKMSQLDHRGMESQRSGEEYANRGTVIGEKIEKI